MQKLIVQYKKKRKKIKARLKEFETPKTNKDIFAELCFCILTPQSKAVYCDKAIQDLKKTGLLFFGSESRIRNKIRGLARFHNRKASYIINARKKFTDGKKLNLKSKFSSSNTIAAREWIVKNIKGIGMKEASHFLRNVGFGKDIAILDVHILRNLKRLGVVKKIPPAISKKTYLEMENRMRGFSRRTNIPLEELDLLFWSRETGFIFK